MTVRTIAVPCYGSMDIEPMLDAGLHLAQPLGAHLEVIYIVPDAAAELMMFPSSALAAGLLPVDRLTRELQDEAVRQRHHFEEWCRTNGVGGHPEGHRIDSVFARWIDEEGTLETVVMRRGRLADLTLVRLPTPGDIGSSRCFDSAVIATGRPVLVVPQRCPTDLLRTVAIAWDGSLEATHAVAMGMPILRAAARVLVVTAGHPHDVSGLGIELVDSLRWHGIEAEAIEPPVNGHGAGETLIATLRKHEASMLVMGAFTHSRIRETLIGGVTRHVLRHSPVPVLMAH
ncbi:MAG TPA: universal stress protein [Stellaceae bacterium]|nr:universal stress protein [Stellaceae bacterium]